MGNFTNLLFTLLLAKLLRVGTATNCFPQDKNLLPHILMAKDSGGDRAAEMEIFTAIDGWTDTSASGTGSFIVYGGSAQSDRVQHELPLPFNPARTGEVAIVARMDLSTNVIRWMRSYDISTMLLSGRQTKYVNGLAIKEDGS